MKKSLYFLLLITLSFIGINSCSKGGGGGGGGLNCSSVPKAFTADVNPIVQGRCNLAGCHQAGSVNGPGALTNHTQVSNARTTIRAAIANGSMPQGSTLTNDQINSILCWIDSGAPNN